MATIKTYTDLEQSEKLKKILPPESADGHYYGDGFLELETSYNPDDTPAWSQAALYNILPVTIGNILEKNALRLRLDKGETDFAVWYENIDTHYVEDGLDVVESNPVDAYFQMICKLHERGLLSK